MTDAIEIPDIKSVERPEKMVTIGGREILCKGLSDTQYMQLVHEAKLFTSDVVNIDRKSKGLDRLFRVMISLIVNPDDRDYVEDLMADGELDLSYFTTVLREIYDAPTPAAVKKQVRRGTRR